MSPPPQERSSTELSAGEGTILSARPAAIVSSGVSHRPFPPFSFINAANPEAGSPDRDA